MKKRIGILDSFRAISVLGVILYHYYSRWTFEGSGRNYYPYDDQYDWFKTGRLGVEFFFIISGFVICHTLSATMNFKRFITKRFIRLFPSLFIACVILFLLKGLDTDLLFWDLHYKWNYIISLCFVSPTIWNQLFHFRQNVWYVDGAFWSLWPEVQFYFFIGSIYYSSKKHFIRNLLLLSMLMIILYRTIPFLNIPFLNSFRGDWIVNGFNLPKYLPWFVLGIIGYWWWCGEKRNAQTFISFTFLSLLLSFDQKAEVFYIYLVMYLLWIAFVFFPKVLFLLNNRVLRSIGVASYSVYLIHQNIGVIIIHRFAVNTFIYPLLLAGTIIFLCWWYTTTIETKISTFLKRRLLKKIRKKPQHVVTHNAALQSDQV